jgi:cytochrome c
MWNSPAYTVARGAANRLSLRREIAHPGWFFTLFACCGSSCAMDSFEINKILGALLFACLCLLSLNIAAGAIFAPQKPAKPGYEIAVQEKAGADAKSAPAEPEMPIAQRLASADIKRGETAAKKCQACHTFEKGGPNRVGPNQWGVLGRSKASVPGFNYSAAMKGKGGNWTVEELDKFLQNPKAVVPGTTMGFAGVSRGTERADLIAYLNSMSDSPQAMPKAAEAPGAPGAPKAQ